MQPVQLNNNISPVVPAALALSLKRCTDCKIKNAAKRTRQHAMNVFHRKSSSTEGRLPLKVIFHQRSSFTEGFLPPKVVFHWRSSFTEVCLPMKVVNHRRSSSTGSISGSIMSLILVIFHWRSSSTEGHLPLKVVFHRRSSSTYLWSNFENIMAVQIANFRITFYFTGLPVEILAWGEHIPPP